TQDLSIGMIERRVEERRHVGVEERAARRIKVDQRAPARMAAGTRLHLGRRARWAVPRRHTALRVLHHPTPSATPEAHDQASRASRGARRVRRARLRPCYMGNTRPVAGLTRHHDLGPRGGIAVLRGVVALTQVRRVALGTLVVPRLLPPGPVQRVWWPQRFAGIEVEPALAAGLLWAGVPGGC